MVTQVCVACSHEQEPKVLCKETKLQNIDLYIQTSLPLFSSSSHTISTLKMTTDNNTSHAKKIIKQLPLLKYTEFVNRLNFVSNHYPYNTFKKKPQLRRDLYIFPKKNFKQQNDLISVIQHIDNFSRCNYYTS